MVLGHVYERKGQSTLHRVGGCCIVAPNGAQNSSESGSAKKVLRKSQETVKTLDLALWKHKLHLSRVKC